ncbi:MAG: Gfo/Idh/MocA family oxidoreductase [Thermogutta sp.]|nr:Gfo/Idh/MocA family oxidoreductase [Thermogutta sp.]
MNRKLPTERRAFLRVAAMSAAASAVPMWIPRSVLGEGPRPGANDRITVGVIGTGGRSNLLIDQLPEQGQILALCDCFLARADDTNAKKGGGKWAVYQDHRQLLDRKDIDAVIVGTPDHARVYVCIHACQAGKDIYAEKPLTLCIGEGRALVRAVRKYQRVFQVGSQQRSMAMNRLACEFIRSGKLGKIRVVQGVNYPGPKFPPELPEEQKPQDLDWDRWLNQAPLRPYNKQLHYGWMAWWDYSGGEMTNWGAHGLDQVQWALGKDGTGPVDIRPQGPAKDMNAPVHMKYDDGTPLRLELSAAPMGGAVFSGENGRIEINRNKFTCNPPDLIRDLPPQEEIDKWRDEVALWQAKYHMENWMDCMRTRELPVADVEIGHRSISISHLANIARYLGRRLQWDPAREVFLGDDEADALVLRPRRAGYELPEA